MDLKLWEYIFEMFNLKIRQKKSIFSKLQTLTLPLKSNSNKIDLKLYIKWGKFFYNMCFIPISGDLSNLPISL